MFINNYGGGNYLSEDGGRTWINASNGCTGSRPRKVEVSPFDPTVIYAAAPSGIWLSEDAGDTWKGMHYPPGNAELLPDYTSILADSELKGHIYTGTRASCILESFDGGNSWEVLWPGYNEFNEIIGYDAEISDLVRAPSDPGTMYAGLSSPGCSFSPEPCGTGMGVVYSRDGGDSWDLSGDTSINDMAVIALAVNPGNALMVYAGTEKGLYLSEDGAVSWSRMTTLPVNGRVRAVATHPYVAEQVFIGIDGYGMYFSDDNGLSWNPLVAGLEANSSLRKIIFDPTDSRIMYTCDLFSGVYRSVDGGENWAVMNEGLFNRGVTDLSITSDGQHLYGSTYGNGVYRMDLNGEPPVSPNSSWSGSVSSELAVALFPNPVSGELYLRTAEQVESIELYNSTGILVFACKECVVMNLSHLPPGCYHALIKFKAKNQRIHKLIVKV